VIHALIAIGRTLRHRYPMPLVEDPYSRPDSKNPPKVLVIDLETAPEGLRVSNFSLKDYDKEANFTKYYFRNPSAAQGPAPSLSIKLPPKITALKQRLGILEILGYKADTAQIAEKIISEINKLKEEGKIHQKTPILLVLKIDGKWPAENKVLQEKFIENFLENLGQKKFRKQWKKKWICHGCGEEKEVYGGVGDLLKFYTVDKYGYAPELDPKGAWRQYALCRDCIFDLERGKRACEEFLTYTFYGKEFWLLPVAFKNLEAVLERFEKFHRSGGELYKDRYEAFEDRLLYEASRREDEIIFYHFLFTKKDNQALRILLHLEEVLPSVIARYLRLKQEVEARFHEFIDACGFSQTFRFNFFSSSGFKASAESPGFTDEDFYALVDSVFREAPVEEQGLLRKAMSRIRKEFLDTEGEEKIPWWLVLEAFLQLQFLLAWKVLKRKTFHTREVPMKDQPFAEFFEPYQEFFDHPAKKALVLLGVLTQKFLNYQYRERGSTPLVKKLKGLRLDQKEAQDLFRELCNKMHEYNIGHWWKELREGISLNFMAAGNRWPLSVDEVGFYIALGMSLSGHPAFKSKEEEKNTEEVL